MFCTFLSCTPDIPDYVMEVRFVAIKALAHIRWRIQYKPTLLSPLFSVVRLKLIPSTLQNIDRLIND